MLNLGRHVGHQEVGRCCTGGESERIHCVSHNPLPSVDKAAQPCFETSPEVQRFAEYYIPLFSINNSEIEKMATECGRIELMFIDPSPA